MKSRLTLTLDPQVTHSAKRAARNRNKSLSALVEDLLRQVILDDAGTKPEVKETFSQRWSGQLKLARKEDARFRKLAEKYDL
jgi:hypothetical protein